LDRNYNLGIIGATGAVGQELIHFIHERNFPCAQIRLFASARSAGKKIEYMGKSWTVEEARPESFCDLDLAIFSAGGSTSKKLAPEAVERGCLVIDNSSAFRMDPKVPLVVPEINAQASTQHEGIIANPNCTTIVALMGLYPLHRAFGLKRFFAATYQAVSGTGAAAIYELEEQVKAWALGNSVSPEVYPHPIAFNLLPHVDAFLENGYTKEEMKMQNESRKIMKLAGIQASTTCVRVPVFRAHSVVINAEFNAPVDLDVARQAITDFSGSELVDEPENGQYPMPIDFAEKEKCGVGRMRRDLVFENGITLWVVGDQLWKGAALNAIQIVEWMHENGHLKVMPKLI